MTQMTQIAQTTIPKRAVEFGQRRTSISLEDTFWNALKEIAASRKMTAAALIAEIDAGRRGNLSSAIREFVLNTYRAKCEEDAA
jgi:predicted DNA-binding ribbon-helix-helix protein